MTRSSAVSTLLRAGGALALLAALAGSREAQAQATITGKVSDVSGAPLGGAQVVIRELSGIGTTTAANGTYTLTVSADRARGQSMTLVARYLGKSPAVRPVTLNAGNQEINFSLRDDPLRLDELVVTGVNEATSSKKLAFAVGRVNADQLQETPGVTALGALAGKVAGVRLSTGSGEPGTAPRIRLRGATSISGTQDPLMIIDGVIARATLADIASEDIERVEVIKGAAASSLYGSDAANGVIQIFTKRGASLADGKLLVTARNEIGSSFMTKRIPTAGASVFKIGADGEFLRTSGGARIREEDLIADNPYPQTFDNQGRLVKPGVFYTNYLSIGQRRGSTNFNASFQNTHTEGVIFGLKGFSRQNFRLNMDQALTPKLDLSISSFYGRSDNNQALEGPGAPFFAVTFVEPHIDLYAPNPDGTPYLARLPDRQSNASNPLYQLANDQINTERSRFTGSGRMRWRMLDWLTAEGSYNFDQERKDFSTLRPFGYLKPTGGTDPGNLTRQAFTGRTYNTSATLIATKAFSGFTNTTKLSYVYEDQTSLDLTTTGTKLIVKDVPEFGAVDPSTLTAGSTSTVIRNRNVFAITTFDIRDKYIVDALIRRDESSLFGPEARGQTYYRASGAWRANEDLRIGGFDEIRLRASYGTAGLRPGFEYQYETLTTGGGSFAKARLGNRALKPARSSEFEIGANIEMGGGRFSLEYTYSRKQTKDQIELVNLLGPAGFNQQWQNAGTLQAKTHELSLGMQVVNTRDLSWVVSIVGDRTRQQITDYPLPERMTGVDPVNAPQIFLVGPGAKLGVMYGNKVLKRIEDLYDDPNKAAQRGAGQAHDPANYVINEEGYVVLKSAHQTAAERPIKYVKCRAFAADGACSATTDVVEIGDANPDFNASFSSSFNYKRFAITGLVDWSQGGSIYNGSRQWPFFENRDRVYDQRGKPEAEKKNANYYNFFYNGLTGIDFFVESATYVKIKELTVSYVLVRDQLKKVGLGRLENVRIGLSGRNLFTFTKYSGYDPEVSGLQGDPFQFRMDWFQYPNFRTLTGTVEIAF
ncbi:MAG: SusC/RagA family TonB-linked outer membrane protein [Gemmatimonadales bacterium]|nr:SusC/RagA family TonB-linked outer membrane protein [Gemmatimonadales bacterium]